MKIQARGRIGGRWKIHRRDRETGRELPPIEGPNAVLAAGKQVFLDIMGGIGGTVFDQTNTDLRIYVSGPTLQKTLDCDSVTHGADDSGTVTFVFSDNTTDTYTVSRLDIYNSSSGVTFSQTSPAFAGGNAKPASENWIYEYTITITQNGDSDLDMDGLDHALRMFTGDRSPGSYSGWDEACRIQVQNSGRTLTETVTVDAIPSRSGETLTWVFTSPAGSDSIQWYYVEVQSATEPTFGEIALSETLEDLDGAGSKGSGVSRVYTFTFSL